MIAITIHISKLHDQGLTSAHVARDFLRRRLRPLKSRAQLAWAFRIENDLARDGPRKYLSPIHWFWYTCMILY